MRNPLKRLPTADAKPTLRERFAAMKSKASTLNAGQDRQPEPADPQTASVPPTAAVPIEIDRHMRAYGERLYAEAYGMADASTRAEQERDAFRALLHTPLASDAERLAYTTAVLARASGVHGLECHGSGRAAWMPTAYRNLAFGEYAPEPDMPLPALAAIGAEREPKAAPVVPDARAFAVEQGALIDLSALSIVELGALFDRFDATANAWNAELHMPYANESRSMLRANTLAGNLIEREQERVAEIRDRIAAEIGRRQPANQRDTDAQLATLIQHELMCNGDLRDPAIRARIEGAWGDARAHDATAESAGAVGNLHAIGREFDAAHAAWRKAVEANREPSQRFTDAIQTAKAHGGPTREELGAAYALPGVQEASDTEEKAFEAAGELALALLKLPVRTLADLAVQARAVIPHVWATGLYEEDGGPDADENIDKAVVRSLIESCCAAAGVDWRGTPVGKLSAAGR